MNAPITFVGGKGGVGKTTLAAACALSLADQGKKTLVLSTDPAHSLGDALEVRLGDTPVPVTEGLWAVEPDAEAAVGRRITQVKEDARDAVPREVMPAVERHLEQAGSSPGMTESALVDLLVDRMEEVGDTWEALVVDSAPTGHLLRLLNLPTLLTPWVLGLTRQREKARRAEAFADVISDTGPEQDEDPLLRRLHARRARLERAASLLRERSRVMLVTLARRMVLAETERAATQLTEAGFTLGPVVVNQLPPQAVVGPDTVEVLATIRKRFSASGVVELPLRESEPTGPEQLRALIALLASGRAERTRYDW